VCAVKECQDKRLKVLLPTQPPAYLTPERDCPPQERERQRKEGSERQKTEREEERERERNRKREGEREREAGLLSKTSYHDTN
jgi:hypothetical protein